MTNTDVVVWGASGYVGAEVLRLTLAHPHLRLAAALSRSQSGRRIGETHPHLDKALDKRPFAAASELAVRDLSDAPLIITCGPNGASARGVAELIAAVEPHRPNLTLIDLSSDFRNSEQEFGTLYGHAHPAPELLGRMSFELPDLERTPSGRLLSHPGCFTTAVTLGGAPIVASGLLNGDFHVSAVTGSTGSGRAPSDTTHHPLRHANYWGYKPLAHRHESEMSRLLSRFGASVRVHFAPHSGPFARGIAATLFATSQTTESSEALRDRYRSFYSHSNLVTIVDSPPRLGDVVGTAKAHICVTAKGQQIVIQVAIDNLLKGAASGAIHMANRLYGWPDDCGLSLTPIPWS